MATSIHSALVQFDGAVYGAAADTMSTTVVRDGVANGLLHCADEYAQVRVNYLPPAAAVVTDQNPFETIDAGPTANQWYRVGGSPFGAWPLTLHSDGTPYKLRIRVGVASSASDATTLTMRVLIAPLDATVGALLLGSYDYVYELSWTASDMGTTPTWTAGTSQGSAASATLLTVDRAAADSWTRSVSAYDAVSSASPVSVQQVPVAAHVFAKTSGTTLPRLHALLIAEYVGT